MSDEAAAAEGGDEQQQQQQTESSWLDTLGNDDRALAEARAWDTPDKALKSYRDLERLKGVPADRLVTLPGEEASPEEWRDVYTKLGAPETADQYEINIPPEVPLSQDRVNSFKNLAHELGLTKTQVQKLAEWDTNLMSEVQTQASEATDTQRQQEMQSLKKEWGAAYDQNIKVARAAARQFGASEEILDAMESAVGLHETLKFMHKVGAALSEDSFETSEDRNGGFNVMSPAQANQKINDLMMDPEFKKKYLSGSKSHIQQINALQEMAHASG